VSAKLLLFNRGQVKHAKCQWVSIRSHLTVNVIVHINSHFKQIFLKVHVGLFSFLKLLSF